MRTEYDKIKDLDAYTEQLIRQVEKEGLIKAPAHMKQEILERSKRLDYQLAVTTRKVSKQMQLFFNSPVLTVYGAQGDPPGRAHSSERGGKAAGRNPEPQAEQRHAGTRPDAERNAGLGVEAERKLKKIRILRN